MKRETNIRSESPNNESTWLKVLRIAVAAAVVLALFVRPRRVR